ncbi:hypothetical protein CAOG_08045 [Capsaspora owczarzaki ATCC 30864]|uniref:Secreted protein n=1 Tax=Capsaspora owczarzaki (strain ATCC 30864) TaxID=595528 RepID=A0A0D2USP9_CAPO3|nr:hypothetical protein CAOG_08045 [Capsaspora owczarzaki ATCC 30864]KJE97986.1 hypothetical protein CAOG_008045 [Capsaspora owczarzaki ATCC 30864]|eukprot:XP_004342646.1 hypothetical protein CAOG_08045 [Capsaspora owczarzaki ATCC 30864]
MRLLIVVFIRRHTNQLIDSAGLLALALVLLLPAAAKAVPLHSTTTASQASATKSSQRPGGGVVGQEDQLAANPWLHSLRRRASIDLPHRLVDRATGNPNKPLLT